MKQPIEKDIEIISDIHIHEKIVDTILLIESLEESLIDARNNLGNLRKDLSDSFIVKNQVYVYNCRKYNTYVGDYVNLSSEVIITQVQSGGMEQMVTISGLAGNRDVYPEEISAQKEEPFYQIREGSKSDIWRYKDKLKDWNNNEEDQEA